MALPSLTPLQESRMRELVEALEAHDACKPSSGSSRKKRRKRRLPRVPRHGGRRPCGHVARVPAVLRVPGASVSVPRQSVIHSSNATETDTLCSPWVGCYAPVVAQRKVLWWSSFLCQAAVRDQQCRKPLFLHWCSSRTRCLTNPFWCNDWWDGPDILCCFVCGGRCPCCADAAGSTGAHGPYSAEKALSLAVWDKVADMPGCATTGIMVQTVQLARRLRAVLGQG